MTESKKTITNRLRIEFQQFTQDLRFGGRMLLRNKSLSILVILCLTVGIGANTTVLSWIEGILLRPFPMVANQDRLVAITGKDSNGRTDVSWPDFQDLQRNCNLIDAFIAEHIVGTTLSIGDHAAWATGSVVSANYFQALGVHPILGRTFSPGEDEGRNAHPVTVISYQAWKDRYQSDPSIIGRTQMLNGVQHTIVGVAPEGFYGTFVGYSFQFWIPASMEEVFQPGGYKLENRDARWIEGFALLKPGVTIQQAQTEMSMVAGRLENEYPATNRGHNVKLYPLWATPFNQARNLFPILRVALVVACFVLLIACANVGNLLLVRSFARRQEMAVRLAVGAGRVRIVKQLLTEGLILSTIAAAGGLLVAYWSRNLIVLLVPVAPGTIVNLPADIDWRVLVLSAGVCLVSTVLFGLIPALQASNVDLAGAMKNESSGVVGGRGRAWIRSGLVAVQVSLSFVLLVAAGLLIKSLRETRNMNPGFSTNQVFTTWMNLTGSGYDKQRARSFNDELIDRLNVLPGVESVTSSRVTPFSYRGFSSAPISVDGYVTAPNEQPTVEYNEVGPEYLATLGVPLLAGREFRTADDETSAPVAIVSEAMANKYWYGQNPVGRRLQVKDRWLQVIGVAKNAKYGTQIEASTPFFFVPLRQSDAVNRNVQIRTTLGVQGMTAALTRELHALDENLSPDEITTLREQMDRMTWSQRAAVILVAVFSGVALVLAAVGLYGVMSYTVFQSTHELGLRMALGATASNLLRLVLRRGLMLTGFGIVLGVGASLALTRLMGDLLYKVSPRDPYAFGCAFVVMVISSLVACLLPAWRATRIDPVRALKD